MKDVIVIPTYNEKKNIKKILRAISAVSPSTSVLVVDDNSPDNTAQEVNEMKKEMPNLELLIREKKEGLGKAYVAAFKKILADREVRCLYTMDADSSHDPKHLLTMLEAINQYDVVIGSRYVSGGGVKGWPFWRVALSRLANIYCHLILRLPMKDCTSGFICIKTSVLEKVDLEKINAFGFAFLVELKYLLLKKGASFKETPIIVYNREEGKSKITFKIILEGVFTSWKLIFIGYKKRLKDFLTTGREIFKKRSIFFLIYRSPAVFYYTFLRKKNEFFNFQNKCYNYFYHLYNCTYLNERAIEVPIVWEIVKSNPGKRILEVGNVLSHYFDVSYDIIDKYDKNEGVINEDVVDFNPVKKYDLIISISTLEHVGWDEEPKDPEKILTAIQNLKRILNPGGKIVVTLPLGYNLEMDRLLREDKIKFTNQFFLKRNVGNKWAEVSQEEIEGIKFNSFQVTANGLLVGIIKN